MRLSKFDKLLIFYEVNIVYIIKHPIPVSSVSLYDIRNKNVFNYLILRIFPELNIFQETLTGFKWMGNAAYDLIGRGERVLFAFEEAIGFMCGVAVLDKDGVSAAVKVAELAAHLATLKMSLAEKLREIYATYGHHITSNSYFICHQPDVLKAIFHRLRNFKENTGQVSTD